MGRWHSKRSWGQARHEALELDGHTCVVCGAGEPLTVHHFVPRRYDQVDPHDPRWLVSLCAECHVVVEHEIRRLEREGGLGRPPFLVLDHWTHQQKAPLLALCARALEHRHGGVAPAEAWVH